MWVWEKTLFRNCHNIVVHLFKYIISLKKKKWRQRFPLEIHALETDNYTGGCCAVVVHRLRGHFNLDKWFDSENFMGYFSHFKVYEWIFKGRY